jgi:hypothetical protein
MLNPSLPGAEWVARPPSQRGCVAAIAHSRSWHDSETLGCANRFR